MQKYAIYSCGVIYRITDTNLFLIGRVTGTLAKTGKAVWSLPKGINENNESFKDTAIREMKEETSIDLNIDKLNYVCENLYQPNSNKHLVLFEYKVNSEEAVDIRKVKCISSFYSKNLNKNLPELNKFMYIDINEAKEYLQERQYKIIKDLNIWN